MKVKLNGEEVDVLPVDGATLVALAGGLLEGVGVEKGEFPKEGKVDPHRQATARLWRPRS